MVKYKVGDVYFDEEGTFIRIKEITNTNIRYVVKYFDEGVYCESPGWDITIDDFDNQILIGEYRKYTRVSRLLYGKF